MDSLAGAQTIEQTTRRLDAGASTNTILVVDDDYPMRVFYRSYLLKAGYHVKLAKDGEEAIALLSKDIALAVIDVVMPRLNGIELLKHIRQAYPDMETIVVTGNGNVDEAVTAMKLGAFY